MFVPTARTYRAVFACPNLNAVYWADSTDTMNMLTSTTAASPNGYSHGTIIAYP